MKKHINKALMGILALGGASQAHAYTYSFSNHTKHTIAVGMKYQGINEPLEYRIIAPNTREQFRPGDPDISRWKVGFVVDKFYYYVMKDPKQQITHDNKLKVAWRALPITWVPSDSYSVALELSEAIGKTTESIGKTGMKAGAAYMTGGASAIAEEAQEALQSGKGGALREASNSEYGLAELLKAVGKAIGHTMAKSRHMDIVEDEDGKISFISML